MVLNLLNNHNWLGVQIDYLLLLQNFRQATGGIFDNFFLFITGLGENFFQFLILCLIYWCINNKDGRFLLLSLGFVGLFNQLLKMTFCIYRPWVLDFKITPLPCALEHSGGYSFPSGHTSRAMVLLGGLAFLNKNKKLLSILLIILVLLVAFSRNYLCVHTPQDVFVGLLVGIFTLFFVKKLLDWSENGKNRDIWLFVFELFCLGLLFTYLALKSYPIDYLNGKVLVEPYCMKLDGFMPIFYGLGLFSGDFISNRFIKFDAQMGTITKKALRFIIGFLVLQFILFYLKPFLIGVLGEFFGKGLNYFITGLFITALYPFIFNKFRF